MCGFSCTESRQKAVLGILPLLSRGDAGRRARGRAPRKRIALDFAGEKLNPREGAQDLTLWMASCMRRTTEGKKDP